MANDKRPSLGLNFLMNTILKMSTLIFPLITFPYVSRVLLPEGYGKVQMALSVISYFAILTQLGLPTYGVRACAAVRDDREKLSRTVHELMTINVVMMVLCYILYIILLAAVPKFQQEKDLYLMVSITIFLSGISMEWMYGGLEQYTYIAVRSMVFKLISVIAMFLMVHSKEDYVLYAGITMIAGAGSNVMNLLNAKKYIDWRFLGSYDLKKHLQPVLVFFAMSCATTIYTSLDSVMLGFLATDADVGYYSAAVKIKNILVSLITALGTVLLPRVSYYIEQNRIEEFWQVLKKSLRFTLWAAIPFIVYFILFAGTGIRFLSGDGYTGAIVPMQITMPTLLFIGLGSVFGVQTLVPLGQEKIVLKSYIAAAVVDFIMNLIVIPKFQAKGVAVSSLAAEMTVVVFQGVAVWRINRQFFRNGGIKNYLLAAAVGGVLSGWVGLLNLPDFWTLAVSAVLFFGSYVLVLHLIKDAFFMEQEKKLITKIFKK